MSGKRHRSRVEIESITFFLKLKAHADDMAIDSNETDVHGADEEILNNFPVKSLDLDKIMRHMLECAAALSRVCRLQKEDAASGNYSQLGKAQGRASYRKLYLFALQEALSGFLEEDEIPRHSSPASEDLLNAFSSVSGEQNSNDWLPLHWAVVATAAGEEQIAEIGRTEAKMLYTEDSSRLGKYHLPPIFPTRFCWKLLPGYTPLHMLCMSPKPDLELLKYFAGGNPAAFMISANRVLAYRHCPLHAAAQYCDSVEALQLLIQTSPQLVRENENGDYTCYPLDVLISNYSESRTSFPDMLKCLLAANDHVEIIGKGVQALIDLLSMKKTLSTTSRQYVCGMIEEILRKCPSLAADYRCKFIVTPPRTLLYHAACTRFAHDEDCIRVLQLLLDVAPEHVTTLGVSLFGGDSLPVHAAAASCNYVGLKFLLELRSETWSARSMKGWNLLHCAVDSMCGDENMLMCRIKYVVNNYPELQYQRNERGETPLIRLIRFNGVKDSEIISMLLDGEAVRMPLICPDPTAELHMALPLHIFVKQCYHRTTDVQFELIVRRLLHLYPEAAGIRNAANHTPYDIARSEEYHTDILRLLLRASPDQDPQALRDLNWEARKMGVWLGSYRAIAIGETLNIMARLRMADNKDKDLMRYIVSFL